MTKNQHNDSCKDCILIDPCKLRLIAVSPQSKKPNPKYNFDKPELAYLCSEYVEVLGEILICKIGLSNPGPRCFEPGI